MQKRDVGVPIRAGVCTGTERMIFWETKIIGGSFIHKRECAARQSVPDIRWNDIECGLYLCFKRRVLMTNSVDVEAGNNHSFVPR
jgi:hypothetical protein